VQKSALIFATMFTTCYISVELYGNEFYLFNIILSIYNKIE
jgi:hypothetical protein